jgi:hypothetical protein
VQGVRAPVTVRRRKSVCLDVEDEDVSIVAVGKNVGAAKSAMLNPDKKNLIKSAPIIFRNNGIGYS